MARNEDRHSHIGIRLQYRHEKTCVQCEAIGWNAVGFNFYHADELIAPTLEFKRGLTHFAGTVVWRTQITSQAVIQSIIVNELIYERAKEIAGDEALHTRLIKLIRVSGMVDEKRQILTSLGLKLHDSQIDAMITRRKLAHPIFHYGVKVESDAWTEIVKNALSISSVVTSLEKWSDAIGKH